MISFTIEGLTGDVVEVALEGTSLLDDIVTEFFGQPIYPAVPTRATAELDIAFDILLHDRACSAPGCDGVEDFSESVQFSAQAAISAQLLGRTRTTEYFSEPDLSDGGLGWGSVAQLNALVVSAVVIPEPSTALLLGLGLVGLAGARRARSTGP